MDCIMIVDDVTTNRMILKEILSDKYEVVEAENGKIAIDMLNGAEKLPQAILLDIIMPVMDGFETLSILKNNPRTAEIPVLFITASDAKVNESRGLNEGATDYISKPFNPDVVRLRIDNQIQLYSYRKNLEQMLRKKTKELILMHERTLETLATIIEYRSLESGEHIRRTVDLIAIMVEHLLNKSEFYAELIRFRAGTIPRAAALHDIGKIGIPDSILLKPGKLMPEEYMLIKTHTVIGSDIIDSIAIHVDDEAGYLRNAKIICRSHHERWDGKGYPEGLKGTDIPLPARIASIVDVYDALVSQRCYKPAYSHEKAVEIIVSEGGAQFDPDIVKAFLEVAEKLRKVEEV